MSVCVGVLLHVIGIAMEWIAGLSNSFLCLNYTSILTLTSPSWLHYILTSPTLAPPIYSISLLKYGLFSRSFRCEHTRTPPRHILPLSKRWLTPNRPIRQIRSIRFWCWSLFRQICKQRISKTLCMGLLKVYLWASTIRLSITRDMEHPWWSLGFCYEWTCFRFITWVDSQIRGW